jgi:hypothetical protein
MLPEVVISKYSSRAVIWGGTQCLSVKIKSSDAVANVKYKIMYIRAKTLMFNSSVEKDLACIKDGISKLLQIVDIYQSTYSDTPRLLKNPAKWRKPSIPTRYYV